MEMNKKNHLRKIIDLREAQGSKGEEFYHL